MDCIYDSDPENSLPLLPESAVDVDLLREFLSLASKETRERLRHEAANTPLRRVFNLAESSDIFALPRNPASSPVRGGVSAIDEFLEIPNDLANGEPIVVSETEIDDALPSQTRPEIEEPILVLDQRQTIDLTGTTDIDTNVSHTLASGENKVNEETENTPKGFARPYRSLRRRTFASVHPYIADQADYLEICSIESMNEMFNAESDLASVVKTLNHLYIRKKKRYPDEDRYRSANFYVHLGKNRVLALQGNADTQAQDILSSSQASDEKAAGDGADGSGDAAFSDGPEPVDFSIPTTPDILSRLEHANSSDDDDMGFMNQSQRSRYSSPEPVPDSENTDSSAEDLSDSEPEQLIKIGGRYRKLSKILKGVLPESAKRLLLFQQKDPVKTLKRKRKEVLPRKGLAKKKFGTISAQSAQLEQELRSFDDDDQEDVFPKDRVQAQFLQASPSIRQLSRQLSSLSHRLESPEPLLISSSEDESDDDKDLFSWNGSMNQSRLEHTSFEADESPQEKRVRTPKSRNVLDVISPFPRKRTASKASNVTPRARGPRLLKRKFHQTTLPVEQPLKRSASKKAAPNSGSKTRNQPAKDTPLKPKNKRQKTQTQVDKHPGGFSSTDYKRTPNSSTFVYEIESLKKFVRPVRVPPFNAQRFMPTRDALFKDNAQDSKNPLLCDCNLEKLDSLGGSYDYFPGADTVNFTFSKRMYTLGLYQLNESREHVSHFLSRLVSLLGRTETFHNDGLRDEIITALPHLMKWFLISRESPLVDHVSALHKILAIFSKFQTKQVRRFQCPIHSQIFAVYWILKKLSSAQSSLNRDPRELEKFALDFWLLFLLSFLADEVKEPIVQDSVMVMRTIFKNNPQVWWLSILEAISECVFVESLCDVIDMVYYLASLVPSSEYNWVPFFTALSMAKNERYSETHHHFLDLYEALINRLDWPFEERVLTSFYSSLARRKFGNFKDEELSLRVIPLIRSESDLPGSTVFERFFILIYRYVSALDSDTKVKRLISKLLPSTALLYQKDHASRAIFVNRVNLVLLLSQISSIDLGAQFKNLIELVVGSNDLKVYLKAAEATCTYSEIALLKQRPLPTECIVSCLKMSTEGSRGLGRTHNPTNKILRLIGSIALQIEARERKIDFIFGVFSHLDLQLLPDSETTKVVGLLLLTLNEPSNLSVREETSQKITEFQKSLLGFLSFRMGLLSESNIGKHRELVELCIQLWNATAEVLKNRHWNVMMFQKFSYMGDAYARNQFLCFFALEYLSDNKVFVRPDDILGIDKLFMRALCASTINGYVVDLFHVLSREPKSIFCSSKWRQSLIDSMYALLANKFQILSDVVRNTSSNGRVSFVERETLIAYLVESLHSEYNKSYHIAGYLELCKHLMEVIRVLGKAYITNMSSFWDFAEKLGLLNRQMQSMWLKLSEDEKIRVFHRELACALQFEKDPLSRMAVWLTETESRILFAVLELYTDLMMTQKAYWCHILFLLDIILQRYRSFEIAFLDGSFIKLMALLKRLAFSSTNSTQFEVQSIASCASLVEFGYLCYEGYIEQSEVLELARVFFANIDLDPSLMPGEPRRFTNLSVEQMLAGTDLNGRAYNVPEPQQVYLTCQRQSVDAYEVEFNNIQRIRQRFNFSAAEPPDFEFSF